MTRSTTIILSLLAGCGSVSAPGHPDAGNGDADTTAPMVTITQMPAVTTGDTTATFVFAADDAGASFQCKLDSGAAATCTSPQMYMALAIGPHHFEVTATDHAGNIGKATYDWTVESPCTTSLIEAENIATHTNWGVASGSVLHNSMALSANVAGASFQLTFVGKGLTIRYEKGPNMGSYNVTVDGGTPVSVSALDPAGFTFQNPSVVASGLPNVQHTATVTCAALNCEVDFFDVTCM